MPSGQAGDHAKIIPVNMMGLQVEDRSSHLLDLFFVHLHNGAIGVQPSAHSSRRQLQGAHIRLQFGGCKAKTNSEAKPRIQSLSGREPPPAPAPAPEEVTRALLWVRTQHTERVCGSLRQRPCLPTFLSSPASAAPVFPERACPLTHTHTPVPKASSKGRTIFTFYLFIALIFHKSSRTLSSFYDMKN